jgi:hypothetical protein
MVIEFIFENIKKEEVHIKREEVKNAAHIITIHTNIQSRKKQNNLSRDTS